MKKQFLYIVAALATVGSFAQTKNDVAAYSTNNLNGTARYQSMSGAFGALGGDMSAININPAGSAVFNNTLITLSATNYHTDNSTQYFNGTSESDLSKLKFNQLGGALVFKNSAQNSLWKKFTMAFNYELNNNFENEYFAVGDGNTSIAQYFINNADGFPESDLQTLEGESLTDAYINIGQDLGYNAQQGFLGYQTFVINPTTEGGSSYVSNGSYTNAIGQEQLVITSGYDSKFTMNFASQYTENFYMGMGLNIHGIERRKITQFDEYGYDENSNLQYVQFDNDLFTYGNGFSFNIGGIAKLNDMVRVGLSYESPTWYNMTDELTQSINTDYYANPDDAETSFAEVAPNTVMVFPDYKIQIPGKITGSMALVFGQNGLLSFDYGYQDMSNAKLKPTSDEFFAQENQEIENEFKAVSTMRLGGEWKINRLSLRAGYRFEGSPYENETTIGDLNGYSLGAGYSFGSTKLDLGFSQAQRDYNPQLYDTGLVSTAAVDSKNTNVTLSLTFNL
ncbi:aromatic hydrocarbon degradation protein [Galbibacter sp. EGI 63066]|uniref:OmpP1/FadL family transporter n=1 Tax=Galbibacter sp. EGI 63066 TaxID=2993559 RepID=UPI002248FF7B|nr:aromatic hydrocarbon degradation protein [Galbibacter sp. EGI 63066]MCX2679589.1 aromatic hydrocarbon degradation protein [Galbibacter sp. EGI 63066]